MATKSKSTDFFKGFVSWFSFLLFLCGISVVAVSLLRIILDPYTAENIAGILSYTEQHRELPDYIFVPAICVSALLVTITAFIIVFREDRHQFEDFLANGLSHVWVEVKLFLVIFFLFISLQVGDFSLFYFLPVVVLIIYFLCLDIGHNHHLFRHNIIHSILRISNSYRDMPGFEQRSLWRLISSLSVILAVLIISGISITVLLNGYFGQLRGPLFVLVCIFTFMATIGTILWYTLALKRDLRDWNELMAQITEMYGGNLNAVNHVSPTSNLYDCAMQLNMIRSGIQKAVEEGTKADRTKVELITNVSHDIKTPLTSIISYVELLRKERDLPPHVIDYINIISRKADRLSNIVQDVFEVSKAATGNISLNMENLDIGKLLRQTFAEMSETLQASPIHWRVDIPETPVMVNADGQRLYRVFQNLIRNCTQYSLEGSRAYVTLAPKDGTAEVCIRNISRNEIMMNGEDLSARFVRGDQNRTSEGSGLGLSIAKSFSEACGGSFFVKTEGDLFTVTVTFPIVPQKIAPAPFIPKPVSSDRGAEAEPKNTPTGENL